MFHSVFHLLLIEAKYTVNAVLHSHLFLATTPEIEAAGAKKGANGWKMLTLHFQVLG